MRLMRSTLQLSVFLLIERTRAAFDLGFGDDSDSYHFVTRPELRSPRFDVSVYSPDEVTPGYWFVAPYAFIKQEPFARNVLQPCQLGPMIYDGAGELVWSGACLVKNQNTCDFRTIKTNNGSTYLSAILSPTPNLYPIGHGIILNDSFATTYEFEPPERLRPFNMHEFIMTDDSTKGMHIGRQSQIADLSGVGNGKTPRGVACNQGIHEFDLETQKTTFIWWAHDHIPHSHSYKPINPGATKNPPKCWDWLHLNAIDKNQDGDYLVTARYTDAIYKVSGKTGKLLWSLGGKESDFVLDGFNLSGPHDGRWIEDGRVTDRKAGKEYITFLDNGGDEERMLAEQSTAYLLELDTDNVPSTARVVHKWVRPDGGRSDRRGNFQLLDNGNAFVGWSENSYISEHTPDGRVLMEARWQSKRLVTYRAYKFNFTGSPTEPPTLKSFVYGESPDTSVSVHYVSWNGATNVASYAFYDADSGDKIGSKQRTGFETMYTTRGFKDRVYVEAIMDDGSVGGLSEVVATIQPADWSPTESRDRDNSRKTADGDHVRSTWSDRSEL